MSILEKKINKGVILHKTEYLREFCCQLKKLKKEIADTPEITKLLGFYI